MNSVRFITFAALPFLVTTPGKARDVLKVTQAYRAENGPRILQDYAKLLEIPNVSADTEDIERNAHYIRAQLQKRGIEATLWQRSDAPPIVYGEWQVEGAERTLGIYVHYDGQPVDPNEWEQPAWTPTLYSAALEDGGKPIPFPKEGEEIDPEWRIYARSAGDDKAPLGALFAALDALEEAEIEPTSNLIFFFEGEEEVGSPKLSGYMEDHREELDRVDLWLICDGPVHQSRRPQLVFGVRGYTGLDITVYGADSYLHSGHYGNWAPNPALELAQLLASMKDASGKVTIEGFYDSVAPIGDSERQAIDALPDVDQDLRRELGLKQTEADNAPLAERILLPSFNIRGLTSAETGPSARNVIPIQATASIDIRLVKGNDPAEMLDLVEAHLTLQGYHLVREEPTSEMRLEHARIARVDRRSGYPAARTELDLPIAQPLIRAAERASGDQLVLLPTLGGSLPLYLFTDMLAKPVVIVPIANHDNNQHAPNENVRLANLWYGIDLFGSILTMN